MRLALRILCAVIFSPILLPIAVVFACGALLSLVFMAFAFMVTGKWRWKWVWEN